ncbi:hypothetical protein LINPERPRIM_LOCUS29678 [Linum perenne]
MSSYHWSCPPPFHHYPTIPLQVFQRRKVLCLSFCNARYSPYSIHYGGRFGACRQFIDFR